MSLSGSRVLVPLPSRQRIGSALRSVTTVDLSATLAMAAGDDAPLFAVHLVWSDDDAAAVAGAGTAVEDGSGGGGGVSGVHVTIRVPSIVDVDHNEHTGGDDDASSTPAASNGRHIELHSGRIPAWVASLQIVPAAAAAATAATLGSNEDATATNDDDDDDDDDDAAGSTRVVLHLADNFGRYAASLESLDLSGLSNLRSIGDSCLRRSGVRHVAVPSGVSIGAHFCSGVHAQPRAYLLRGMSGGPSDDDRSHRPFHVDWSETHVASLGYDAFAASDIGSLRMLLAPGQRIGDGFCRDAAGLVVAIFRVAAVPVVLREGEDEGSAATTELGSGAFARCAGMDAIECCADVGGRASSSIILNVGDEFAREAHVSHVSVAANNFGRHCLAGAVDVHDVSLWAVAADATGGGGGRIADHCLAGAAVNTIAVDAAEIGSSFADGATDVDEVTVRVRGVLAPLAPRVCAVSVSDRFLANVAATRRAWTLSLAWGSSEEEVGGSDRDEHQKNADDFEVEIGDDFIADAAPFQLSLRPTSHFGFGPSAPPSSHRRHQHRHRRGSSAAGGSLSGSVSLLLPRDDHSPRHSRGLLPSTDDEGTTLVLPSSVRSIGSNFISSSSPPSDGSSGSAGSGRIVSVIVAQTPHRIDRFGPRGPYGPALDVLPFVSLSAVPPRFINDGCSGLVRELCRHAGTVDGVVVRVPILAGSSLASSGSGDDDESAKAPGPAASREPIDTANHDDGGGDVCGNKATEHDQAPVLSSKNLAITVPSDGNDDLHVAKTTPPHVAFAPGTLRVAHLALVIDPVAALLFFIESGGATIVDYLAAAASAATTATGGGPNEIAITAAASCGGPSALHVAALSEKVTATLWESLGTVLVGAPASTTGDTTRQLCTSWGTVDPLVVASLAGNLGNARALMIAPMSLRPDRAVPDMATELARRGFVLPVPITADALESKGVHALTPYDLMTLAAATAATTANSDKAKKAADELRKIGVLINADLPQAAATLRNGFELHVSLWRVTTLAPTVLLLCSLFILEPFVLSPALPLAATAAGLNLAVEECLGAHASAGAALAGLAAYDAFFNATTAANVSAPPSSGREACADVRNWGGVLSSVVCRLPPSPSWGTSGAVGLPEYLAPRRLAFETLSTPAECIATGKGATIKSLRFTHNVRAPFYHHEERRYVILSEFVPTWDRGELETKVPVANQVLVYGADSIRLGCFIATCVFGAFQCIAGLLAVYGSMRWLAITWHGRAHAADIQQIAIRPKLEGHLEHLTTAAGILISGVLAVGVAIADRQVDTASIVAHRGWESVSGEHQRHRLIVTIAIWACHYPLYRFFTLTPPSKYFAVTVSCAAVLVAFTYCWVLVGIESGGKSYRNLSGNVYPIMAGSLGLEIVSAIGVIVIARVRRGHFGAAGGNCAFADPLTHYDWAVKLAQDPGEAAAAAASGARRATSFKHRSTLVAAAMITVFLAVVGFLVLEPLIVTHAPPGEGTSWGNHVRGFSENGGGQIAELITAALG